MEYLFYYMPPTPNKIWEDKKPLARYIKHFCKCNNCNLSIVFAGLRKILLKDLIFKSNYATVDDIIYLL